MSHQEEKFYPYALIVWFIAILFYFYEFFLRILPATISLNIMEDLHLTLDKFALIGSAYYITYSLMQVPVGVLIDRFGVRLLSSIACVICTVGLVGFSFAESYVDAIISRLLIGFGSSFGFISLLVLAFSWFPHRYFGFLGGLGQALGAVGPLIAGAPIIYVMKLMNEDWRALFLWISIFGSILSFFIFFFIRNKPAKSSDTIVFLEKNRSLKEDFRFLIKIPHIWMTLIYTGFIYVTLPLLGAYWGSLYFQARGFDKASSSFMVSMIWIGLAIGSPLFGKISDQMRRRKPVLIGLGLLGTIVSLTLIFFPTQNKGILSILLVLVGMSAGGQSLAFALIAEYVPSELKATAIGMNNTAVMLFAAVLPPLATLVIQMGVGNHAHLTQSDFSIGFLLMPIANFLAALVCLFGIKETFCKPQHKIHHI